MTMRPVDKPFKLHRDPFPRPALYAAAVAVFGSLFLVGLARLTGYMENVDPGGHVVAEREIAFKSDTAGLIDIADGTTGETLARFPVETNRFVRVVMTSLEFERAGTAPGTQAPYKLVRWDDGRISVDDPVSGKSIQMAAFGRNQVLTFEKLLD